jgi:hypothetical protein
MIPDAATGASRDYFNDIGRLLPISVAVVLALALFVVTIATVMAFVLRSDVAALEDRARTAAQAAKTLQDDLAALKATLGVAQTMRAAERAVAETPAATAGLVLSARNAFSPAARAVKVHAANPRPECVFLSGDPYGLADCIRREEGAMHGSAQHYR